MSFFTISNEVFFPEPQIPKLGAIVAPNEGLHLNLLGKNETKKVSRVIWPWVNVKEYGNKSKPQNLIVGRLVIINLPVLIFNAYNSNIQNCVNKRITGFIQLSSTHALHTVQFIKPFMTYIPFQPAEEPWFSDVFKG